MPFVGDAGPIPLAEGESAALELWTLLSTSPLDFVRDPERAGADFSCTTPLVGGRPNRARIKIWSPRRGTVVAFLYKDSQVPFSTDRFSYGALIVKGESLSGSSKQSLLDYIASGFHPPLRPVELKRAFPFTLPR